MRQSPSPQATLALTLAPPPPPTPLATFPATYRCALNSLQSRAGHFSPPLITEEIAGLPHVGRRSITATLSKRLRRGERRPGLYCVCVVRVGWPVLRCRPAITTAITTPPRTHGGSLQIPLVPHALQPL